MVEEEAVATDVGARRVRIALVATLLAVPLLLLDNLSGDEEAEPEATTPSIRTLVTGTVPDDRPESGPAKGISVVTSSTTSSTVPITVTTTTVGP